MSSIFHTLRDKASRITHHRKSSEESSKGPSNELPYSSPPDADRQDVLSHHSVVKFPEQTLYSPQTTLPSSAADGVSDAENLFLKAVDGGRSTSSPTLVAKSRDIAYATFKATIDVLRGSSGMFPPLQIAVEGIISIVTIIDQLSQNKTDFQALTHKLGAINSIIQRYQKDNSMAVLETRVKDLSQAIYTLKDEVESLQKHGVLRRLVEGTSDAGVITNILGQLGFILKMFQLDTDLHTESNTEKILQKLTGVDAIGNLKYAEDVSYKAQRGREFHGCMKDTRIGILDALERWASDDDAPKVCWLNGMAGIGKSSIALTLSERLDAKLLLGASFFCSHSADNARLIVPTISHMLGRISPPIRSAISQVLENDQDIVSDSVFRQFNGLIVQTLRRVIPSSVKTYKVVVIDAVDECSEQSIVESLVNAVLISASEIPLKFLFTSRPESHIREAFRYHTRTSDIKVYTEIPLQEVTQGKVQNDIEIYLRSSLSKIGDRHGYSQGSSPWPPKQELETLLRRSGGLFIYAATAVRYIGHRDAIPRKRLTKLTGSALPLPSLDSFYKLIMDEAFQNLLDEEERSSKHDVLAAVTFLRTPQPMADIASLLDMPNEDIKVYLSGFHSVIQVPSTDDGRVSIFHASFHEFIINPDRCLGHSVDYVKGHQMLAVKCLQLLNKSLRRNICDLSEGTIGSLPHEIKNPNIISGALRYSCLYWEFHLAEALVSTSADVELVFDQLCRFADEHVLHWFECLSILGELESGLKSLAKATKAISKYSKRHAKYALLFEDAHRCLQMGFEAIKHHCLNTYHSALVWIPKQSRIRKQYATSFRNIPQVVVGLADSWGPLEHTFQYVTLVSFVAFSPDDTRIVSGLNDNSVQIRNAITGEIERILVGHLGMVTSVGFSPDGTHIVSSSTDKSIRIWDATTGETERILEGHSNTVNSVAYSSDGTRIVSGSGDKCVRIWNTTTGETELILEGHSHFVDSVNFSPDGTGVVSGSCDNSVRIWDLITGEIQRILEGHSDWVSSVAFSHDGTRVVSGSRDNSVLIWNLAMGEIERALEGHSSPVTSVAFSGDGTRVVSGSIDSLIRIWKSSTGEIERILEGHSNRVSRVAFSHDGTRVVSGSDDSTVRIWNVNTEQMERKPKGHSKLVSSLAFSADGTRVVAGSYDGLIRIWNTSTGEVENILEGHSGWVTSTAFSPDGTHIVSGSDDTTVRVWNSITGKIERRLEGHSKHVTSVSFSADGKRIVSGSRDKCVRIWNATTGESEHVMEGHSHYVTSVGFSPDGIRVVSGSYDDSTRIWNVITGQTERVLEGHRASVRPVAFSADGTCVVFGSWDRSVWIWNTITGESTSLSEFDSCQLSDGSKVCHYEAGRFQLFVPKEHGVYIAQDGKWILTDPPTGACWIPTEFRAFNIIAFSRSKACFGYGSFVVVVDLTLVNL